MVVYLVVIMVINERECESHFIIPSKKKSFPPLFAKAEKCVAKSLASLIFAFTSFRSPRLFVLSFFLLLFLLAYYNDFTLFAPINRRYLHKEEREEPLICC